MEIKIFKLQTWFNNQTMIENILNKFHHLLQIMDKNEVWDKIWSVDQFEEILHWGTKILSSYNIVNSLVH